MSRWDDPGASGRRVAPPTGSSVQRSRTLGRFVGAVGDFVELAKVQGTRLVDMVERHATAAEKHADAADRHARAMERIADQMEKDD